MTEFARHLHSEVLRRSVVVACGDPKAVYPRFLRAFRGFDVSRAMLKETWGRLMTAFEEHERVSPNLQGLTWHYEGDVYIYLPKWSTPVFVHEVYHATQAVLRDLDTHDEELGAYVQEWIYEQICGRNEPDREKEER